MPYTVKNPPAWLKNLPKGAIKIGVAVFNSVLARDGDEEKARRASWAAIKAKYEKTDSGEWKAKQTAAATESDRAIHFRAARQADDTGLAWEAVLIAPGLSKSSPAFYWSEEVLAAAADKFVGVDINAYELTTEYGHLQIPDFEILEDVKRYLVSKKVGTIEKAWYEEGTGIKAVIRFLAEQAWVARTIQEGIDQGRDTLGLSIDSRIKGFEVPMDGDSVIWVTEIISASSVDVVTRPAAGGRFIRAVMGLQKKEDEKMDRAKLLALILRARPDLLDGKETDKLTDEEILGIAQQAMQPPAAGGDHGTAAAGTAGTGTAADDGSGDAGCRAAQAATPPTIDEIKAMVEQGLEVVEKRAACAARLDRELAASELPELAQARIRKQFTGKVFEDKALADAIRDEKDYLAKMAGPGAMPGMAGDGTRAAVGLGSADKVQLAMDRLFGLTKENLTALARMERLDQRPLFPDLRASQAEDFDNVPRATGIRELYVTMTGDGDITGQVNPAAIPAEIRAAQSITSATFTYALGNTLNRRLVRDYREYDFQTDLLVSVKKPVKDFRTQEAVLVGGFPDIADVDPETADYAEITAVTDEEATYSLGQKGNILTITRKYIKNDDLSVITRLLRGLARATARTHGKYVWNFWINNSNCTDGTAWFTSGHGNLTTSALTFATALAAYQSLAKMTEKDSGERLGLLSGGVKPVLVYPIDLMDTGEQIVSDDFYYSSNDLTTKTRNPLKGKITGAMPVLLTDANDWGLLLPPNEIDMVEMGYMDGREEPEFFLADSPQSEQVFVADKVRYKVRQEYAGTVVDFRSGYKGVVA